MSVNLYVKALTNIPHIDGLDSLRIGLNKVFFEGAPPVYG